MAWPARPTTTSTTMSIGLFDAVGDVTAFVAIHVPALRPASDTEPVWICAAAAARNPVSAAGEYQPFAPVPYRTAFEYANATAP